MHCKKCLHYEVCVKLGKPSLYGINQEIGCSTYKDKEKWAEKKETVTNADLIRAMSDETLANIMAGTPICKERYMDCLKDGRDCEPCLLEWLKQPVEE